MPPLHGFRHRAAARSRLPIGLALLVPALFSSVSFTIMVLLIRNAVHLHSLLHDERAGNVFSQPLTGSVGLILVASFLIGASASMLVSNLILRVIPPVRRILEASAKGAPGARSHPQ